MPFTPAHAAIALPLLRKKWASATGLIIGTVAPDFEYFFKLSVDSEHSHTIGGLIYFDLPVAVLLALIFHLVVKQNLINNLPPFLQRRFQDTLIFDFRNFLTNHWFIFLASALIGSASHIFWDGFTHGDGYFVRRFPSFYSMYVPYDGVRYPMFYALQHTSTAIGLTFLFIYIFLKNPSTGAIVQPRMEYWLLVLSFTGLVVLIRFAADSWDPPLGNLVVSLISGLCLAVIVTGLIKFKTTIMNFTHGQENSVGTGRKA
jgi:hypothetical protein